MSYDLYYSLSSAPCRAVMLTAKAVGVKLNLKKLHMSKGEHLTPKFLALNFQHTIPTLVDGDYSLWESRAIINYLASKYGKDDTLLPKDPRARAEVEKLLNFDIGTLYTSGGNYVLPVMFQGEKFDPKKLEKVHEALGYLNTWLSKHDYVASNNITVADHSLSATVENMKAADIDVTRHPNVVAWLARCQANMPGYKEINIAGAKEFGKFYKSKCNS